VRTIDMGGTNL